MLTEKRLYQGQPGTTNTVLYTVPASTTTVVKEILVTNTTGGTASFNLHVAPSATGTAVANAIAYNVTLAPNAVWQYLGSLVCNAGDTIRALQSPSATTLTFNISGYEDAA